MKLLQVMSSRLPRRVRGCAYLWPPILLFFLICAGAVHAQAGDSAQLSVTVDEYIARLRFFDRSISVCQKEMTPKNCRSSQIGPDLTVAFSFGKRTVRLDWLRQLMDNAAKGENAKSSNANKQPVDAKRPPLPAPIVAPPVSPRIQLHPPSIAAQLEDAHRRLSADAESARRFSTEPPSKEIAGGTPERRALTRILAAKEYRSLHEGPSLIQQIKERVGNWINQFIGKLIRAGAHSRWIGLTAEITFVLLVCVALVWLLIRIERQGRMSPIHIGAGRGAGAPSARDWQLWLEDAQKAAARGAWRDAIHLLYWASVSRLESAGYWPADKARTPREYLMLLGPQNPHHESLGKLTRSFERAWYAGRPTSESDYREAEQLSFELGLSGRLITVTR